MFKITVIEVPPFEDQWKAANEGKDTSPVITRYEQTIDTLNLQALIAAINRTPRKSRAKKEAK